MRDASPATAADPLLEPWFACLRARLGPPRLFDAHTHLGTDPDGSRADAAELERALELVAGRAVVFPFAAPGDYREENDSCIEAAAGLGGRLLAFCRVNPHDGGVTEAERALGRGAVGIKLHPRAERFRLADASVQPVLALANERRLPVVFHAGRGIEAPVRTPSGWRSASPMPGSSSRTPRSRTWRGSGAGPPAHPNLFFDTAWWNTADQLALFALVPPGQILFASDTPYGHPVAAASLVLRAALAAGLTPEQIAGVAGGQLERLVEGRAPLDLGPAPAVTPAAPGPLLERLHTLLLAAIARMTGGQASDEYLELAQLACMVPDEHPDAAGRDVGARAAEAIQATPRHRPAPGRSATLRHPLDLRGGGARAPTGEPASGDRDGSPGQADNVTPATA